MGSELFLFMKETSTFPFPSYREQDCTTEHCDEIKGKLQIEDKFTF